MFRCVDVDSFVRLSVSKPLFVQTLYVYRLFFFFFVKMGQQSNCLILLMYLIHAREKYRLEYFCGFVSSSFLFVCFFFIF